MWEVELYEFDTNERLALGWSNILHDCNNDFVIKKLWESNEPPSQATQ